MREYVVIRFFDLFFRKKFEQPKKWTHTHTDREIEITDDQQYKRKKGY